MRKLLLSLAGVVLLMLAACQSGAVDERAYSNGCWPVTDTLSGLVAVNQAGAQPVTLNMAFDPDYAYQNLFVKVLATAPSGKKTELLYDLELLDPGGNWLITKDGSGYRYNQPLQPALALTETGNYRLQVFHYMRDSALCHVRSVQVTFGKP